MDIARITKIYDELDGYSIELDADPTTLGPQYLGKVISQCRNYLNRTTSFLLEIRRERHMTSNEVSAEKAAFKIESDGLLAGDERVRSRPNIRDREAVINVILQDRVNRITELENVLRNLEAVEGAVKVRHTELVRTDGQIKTQRSLIRDEIDTKSFFGDEHDGATRRTADVDEAELERIMAGGGTAEPTVSASVFTPPDPVNVEIVSPAVDAVLEINVQPVKPAESIDLKLTETVETAVEPTPAATARSAIEEALAAADEAVASTKEPEPAPVVVAEEEVVVVAEVVADSDAEVMNRFLDADPADKSAEAKPAAKGRKASTAKKKDEVVVVASTEIDPDFADILAGL